MTKSKKVVIVGPENVLSESIMIFLAAQKNWEIIRLPEVAALDGLLHSVDTRQTDVVMIVNHAGDDCLSYFSLKLLHDHPSLKIILLSLENNLVDVYSRQKILAKEVSDLVAAIENDSVASIKRGAKK